MAETSTHPDEMPGLPFLVAGVGASAGGLEAYVELLSAFPPDPGLALLIVSHLVPDQKSHLAEILGRSCKMAVHEVVEGMRVKKNNVYVIPPNCNMALTDGHLTLTPRDPRGVVHMPIDYLFRSLATIQKSQAVGIILSGNGSDGSIGFQAIKAASGVTFAQDEKSAKHSGMPRAALQDGNVDHVMPPKEIALELQRVARHPYSQVDQIPAPIPTTEDPINEILELLRNRTGVDFSNYKQTTIRRRILRRMALLNLQEPREYLGVLQSDAGEVQHLFQDFLIRVTQFFRDPEALEALKEKVFPELIKNKQPGAVVRIWVAGCATGEEAYSLAICLLEFLDDRSEDVGIKILATDLNEIALEKARSGIYLDNIEMDVSPTRLRRFFVRSEGHYQISKAVRELCVFSRHNMATDPPFGRIDLVSCRNVLIYMDAALQKQVMPLLHYAMSPEGFLLLGTSEHPGVSGELFQVVDLRHKIFSRNNAIARAHEFNTQFTPEGTTRINIGEERPALWSALDVQKEADRVLLNRYAPVGVVVDEAMTVVQFRGRTVPYLEPAPGMATLDLFRMLREGLLAEVRSATIQAKSDNTIVIREGLRFNDGTTGKVLRIEVIPFKVPPAGVRFYLVMFLDISTEPLAPAPVLPTTPADKQVAQLQLEMSALREYLQSVIESQESSNEELKSANEEILSANEELQSTNEELQTAKEEAQSANEELATVNEELRHRNAELARANNDLVNVLRGVGLPIVMVGRDLRVRRFTPMAEKLFNLIPGDVGRPIGDLKQNLLMEDLPDIIARVIDSLTPYENEVRDTNGTAYSVRIRPYVTLDNTIDGASIVLVDVDALRKKQPPPTAPHPPGSTGKS